MHAKEIQTELRMLSDIARYPEYSAPSPAATLDVDWCGHKKPVAMRVYATLGDSVRGCGRLLDAAFDDFPEALAAASRAVSLLESSRIIGAANPGEGDFIKHLGRA